MSRPHIDALSRFASALFVALLAVVPAFVMLSSQPAEARRYGNCYWDGTPPICAGSCKRGFVVRRTQSCFSGHRVQCCERLESTQKPKPLTPQQEVYAACERFCNAYFKRGEKWQKCFYDCLKSSQSWRGNTR